jgi:transposase-like protein
MTMTTATLVERAHDGDVRDDDPAAKPVRRRFSTEYKLAVLAEYEQLTDAGAKGALLRREGLYSSHIVEWRRAKQVGAIGGTISAPGATKKRSDTERELERLRKRNERLEEQLDKHKKALRIQGKASELLARLLAESDDSQTKQQP